MSEDVGRFPEKTGSGHRSSFDPAKAWRRVLGLIGVVVRWAGTVVAALLTIHVVLTVGNANPDNEITRFAAEWARPFALGFHDLFQPADPKLEVLLNYGAAALFWLIITSIAMRILRALSA